MCHRRSRADLRDSSAAFWGMVYIDPQGDASVQRSWVGSTTIIIVIIILIIYFLIYYQYCY